jgi:enoyl-CoA hydratase
MAAATGALGACPVPAVAWIDGWCLGGGLELALAADLRWASPRVRIGMPVAQLGIMLSPTFARRLVLAMGEALAKDLLFTARSLHAEEALRSGVVSRILEPDVFGQARDAFVQSVSRLYPRAVSQAKVSVGQTIPAPADRTAYFVDAEDFAAAIASFRR